MQTVKKGTRAEIISALLVLVISIVGAISLKVDTSMIVITPLLGLLFFGKFIMAMMFSQGWKIFNRKTVAGMPRPIFVFYVIIITILCCMIITNNEMGPGFDSSQRNVLSFIIAASAGVIASLFAWYCGINEWMASGSEYDARILFRDKGDSPEIIEEKIEKLKKLNLILK